MKSFGWVLCGTIVLLSGLGLGEAQARFQDPTQQPPGFSPYLNLFRRGSNVGMNYYDMVRPQLQNQANFQTLQQQQIMIQRQLRQGNPTPEGHATAHVPGYMTHGKYFMHGGTIAAGTGQTRKSLSDRRVNTGIPQTRDRRLESGISPTRTVIRPNNDLIQPVAPFNPYRGF